MALFPLTEFSVIQINTVIYSRSFCKRKDTVSQKMYSLLVLTVSANLVGQKKIFLSPQCANHCRSLPQNV